MEEEMKRLGIWFSKELLDMVDEYRTYLPGVPDRTNAIREMIKVCYESHKQSLANSRKD